MSRARTARLALIRLGQWWFGGDRSPWRWIKEHIAYRWFIDNEDRCWSEDVMWFMGYREKSAGGSLHCIEDARRDGYCYCGRFACKSRLEEIGASTEGFKPLQWVEARSAKPGEGSK